MPCQALPDAARQVGIIEQSRRQVDRERQRPRLTICQRNCRYRLVEDKVGELFDAVMLLGRTDEFRGADRPFFWMGPSRQRLDADDFVGREVELGLVGDPNFALFDRIVELAEQRQLPRRVGQARRVVIFPLETFGLGFIGRDHRAAEPIGCRATAADVDSEADHDVIMLAADFYRTAEQRVQRFEVVTERKIGLGEPGEQAFITMINAPPRSPDAKACGDLVGQKSLGIMRQG